MILNKHALISKGTVNACIWNPEHEIWLDKYIVTWCNFMQIGEQ